MTAAFHCHIPALPFLLVNRTKGGRPPSAAVPVVAAKHLHCARNPPADAGHSPAAAAMTSTRARCRKKSGPVRHVVMMSPQLKAVPTFAVRAMRQKSTQRNSAYRVASQRDDLVMRSAPVPLITASASV